MALFTVNYLPPVIFFLGLVLKVVTSSGLKDRVDNGDAHALIPKVKLNEKYSIYRKSLSWAQAQIYCEAHEGELATFYHYDEIKSVVDKIYEISDPLTADYIKGITTTEFGLDRRYWIGLTDLVAGEGKWFWSGIGKRLVYEAMWYPGQPDHIDSENHYLGRPEHCVGLWNPVFHKKNQHHTFADQECRNKYYFICERNDDKLAAQEKWKAKENTGTDHTNVKKDKDTEDENMPVRTAVLLDDETTERTIALPVEKTGKMDILPEKEKTGKMDILPEKEKTEKMDILPEKEKTEKMDILPEKEKTGKMDILPEKEKTGKMDILPEKEKTEKMDILPEKEKTEKMDILPEKEKTEKMDILPEKEKTEKMDILPEDKKTGRRTLFPAKENIHLGNLSNNIGNDDKKLETVFKLAEKLIQLPNIRTLLESTDSTEIQNQVKYLEKEILKQEKRAQPQLERAIGRTILQIDAIKDSRKTATEASTITTSTASSNTKKVATTPSTTTTSTTTTTTSTTKSTPITSRRPTNSLHTIHNKLRGHKPIEHQGTSKILHHLRQRLPHKLSQTYKVISKVQHEDKIKKHFSESENEHETSNRRRKLMHTSRKHEGAIQLAKVAPSSEKLHEHTKRPHKHRHGKHLTTKHPLSVVNHKSHHNKIKKHRHHPKPLISSEQLSLATTPVSKEHGEQSRSKHKFLKKMMKLFDALEDDYD